MSMTSEFEPLRRRSANSSGVQSLALALFLVILAFFIMLVSISTFEDEKVSSALQSVQQQFRSGGESERTDSMIDPQAEARALQTAFLERLRSLLASEIASARAEADPDGTVLYLAFPASQFFAPGSVVLRGERTALFEGIAQIIEERPAGSDVTLEVFFDSNGLAPTTNGPQMEVRQAAAIGADLVARGVLKEFVSVGLRPGSAGVIEFIFRLRTGSEPLFGVNGGAGETP
jgi:hypothetical protein